MKVSQWTSAYNDQFRNTANVISPNAGEPMFHFAGNYDPSHWQRDPGFYGTRAKLAAEAKFDATQNGRAARVPEPNQGPVGYGTAPVKQRTQTGLNQSYYAPPPDPRAQQYSALRQNGANQLLTQRIGADGSVDGAGVNGVTSSSSSFSSRTSAQVLPYGDKDLWTHPVLPHLNKSGYSEARPLLNGSASARFAQTSYNGSSSSGPTGGYGQQQQQQQFSASAGANNGRYGLVDPAFVDGPNEWRYTERGVAQTKNVDLRRNTDPRQKFHIPGYQGFVRGKQFVIGETFAKMTRTCLDVPLDLPTDID